MKLESSTRRDKRLMATFQDGRIVHFGFKGGRTYIDHGDKEKRKNYLARHKVNEDWSDPYSPGALSRYLLWGDSTDLEKNHRKFMKLFNVS